MATRKVLASVLALSDASQSYTQQGQRVCKPLPGEVNWPTETAWESLNSLGSGRLTATITPGSAGINFAYDTGVRLIVKGSIHDYPGRSSGGGSLSIHTIDIRGLTLSRDDNRAASYGGIGALKISADVGIGGWITAGGHGPLTAKYGLGADQVVEMEVSTADGVSRTIDAEHDEDLFWAMRGGGGSTFAVMTSVTVVVYPPVKMTEYLYAYNTTANSDTFWSMVTYFHTQIPTLSEAGLMGYYFASPSTSTETNNSIASKLSGIWLAPNKRAAEVQSIIAPLEEVLLSSQFQWVDAVVGGGYTADNITFSPRWASSQPEAVGTSGRLGSRLLDKAALEDDEQKLKDALRTSTPPPWMMLGHAVAGPGTRTPAGGERARDNSALKAWRSPYTHAVLPRSWPPRDLATEKAVCDDLRVNRTAALRRLAPNTGAYRNEAAPTEPIRTWTSDFSGDDYTRLMSGKSKWDPERVFWCKTCVDSDCGWIEALEGDKAVENGVGQDPVRICRLDESEWEDQGDFD